MAIMATRHRSRREFLGWTAAGFAGMVSAPWLAAGAAVEPRYADLVVLNAKVYTVDPSAPRAEAFAVRSGRFLAVGRTDEIRGLIGKGSETIDAQQMTIVPGFIDCHNHTPGT